MAISEYAPGSQIVANGNLITSRYIKKVPNMSWKMYDYIYCDNCKTLNVEPHVFEDEYSNLNICHQCNNPINKLGRKTFLVPAFGFEADGDRIEKPSLIRPEKTYRSEIAYVGNKPSTPINFRIGNSEIELIVSQSDEMVVLNESNFFVCETCGYTDLDEKHVTKTKQLQHKNSGGYICKNGEKNHLKRFSLGYRFETDVVQLRFLNPDLTEWENALSILYAVLKGICNYLNIEQNDISGCLQYFYNTITYRPNYALILYDRTPGGAGHVKRLDSQETLQQILIETLNFVKGCACGGEAMDSSCYSCLRNYYNQKHHDILKRSYVVEFLEKLLVVSNSKKDF
jgi:predicted nucleic-acid-binding Zn-ribbon protein